MSKIVLAKGKDIIIKAKNNLNFLISLKSI